MRHDRFYLEDMLEAIDEIEEFLEEVSEEGFLGDRLIQSAVLQKLIVLGEAAGRVSREMQAVSPEIEWRTIVGLRNVAVHEYFAIQWRQIWMTARLDLPPLRERIRAVIGSLPDS